MKKFIAAAIAACTLAAGCFGCSGKKNTLNADALVGRWEFADSAQTGRGYIFEDNGKVSVFADVSSSFHFSSKGFVFGNECADNKNIKYEDGILTVKYFDNTILKLERIGEADTDTWDGEYVIGSCVTKMSLVSSMQLDEENVPELRMTIDGEKASVTVVGLMAYEVSDGKIEFSRYSGGESVVQDVGGDAEISGDNLTIKCLNGTERKLKRA